MFTNALCSVDMKTGMQLILLTGMQKKVHMLMNPTNLMQEFFSDKLFILLTLTYIILVVTFHEE